MSETTISRSRKRPPSNGRNRELQEPIENVAMRSRQLLAAMVAFRDGDFSVRLPGDWPGTDGRIAEVFNQTLAYERRITREVARLSGTVGKEGRLKQRMALPGAIGGWAVRTSPEKHEIPSSLDQHPTEDPSRLLHRLQR